MTTETITTSLSAENCRTQKDQLIIIQDLFAFGMLALSTTLTQTDRVMNGLISR